MNKAVFLDRDGVINRERGQHTWKIEDFEILPDLIEALKTFSKKGFLLIIITNQSGISKGLYGHEEVRSLHDYLNEELSKHGLELNEIYYCPHHENSGRCLCRKPNSLMLEKAIARFDIDTSQSIFIGDKERDIKAGEKVGVKGILIEANTSLLPIADRL